MRSWVRYSVTVYLGLLLAGSIATPIPGGVAPKSRLRASYQTTSPVRPDLKIDPAPAKGKGVGAYHGAGVAWQSSARADSPR